MKHFFLSILALCIATPVIAQSNLGDILEDMAIEAQAKHRAEWEAQHQQKQQQQQQMEQIEQKTQLGMQQYHQQVTQVEMAPGAQELMQQNAANRPIPKNGAKPSITPKKPSLTANTPKDKKTTGKTNGKASPMTPQRPPGRPPRGKSNPTPVKKGTTQTPTPTCTYTNENPDNVMDEKHFFCPKENEVEMIAWKDLKPGLCTKDVGVTQAVLKYNNERMNDIKIINGRLCTPPVLKTEKRGDFYYVVINRTLKK